MAAAIHNCINFSTTDQIWQSWNQVKAEARLISFITHEGNEFLNDVLVISQIAC